MKWPTTTDELLASMSAAKEALDAIRREGLRGWSEAIEKSKCPKCGHKPTLTNSGSGDTLEICESIMAAIRERAVPSDKPTDPFVGIRLKVDECRPRPPLQ